MRPLARAVRAPALLCLAALACAFVPPARAQEPRVGSLQVIVFDAATGVRIGGAVVMLQGGRSGRADGEGIVLLHRLPPGAVRGEIAHLGYAARRFIVPVSAGDTVSLSVPLEPRPVALSGVEVVGATDGVRSPLLRDFYQRARTGSGHYVTREQIDRWRTRQLTDVLRMMPGLAFRSTPVGDRPTSADRSLALQRGGGRSECPLQVFLDGTPLDITGSGLIGLDLRPEEVEGIEYYRAMQGVPSPFRRANQNCGVLLIWKREQISRQ